MTEEVTDEVLCRESRGPITKNPRHEDSVFGCESMVK